MCGQICCRTYLLPTSFSLVSTLSALQVDGTLTHASFVRSGGGAWDFLYMYNRDILEKRYHQSIPEEDIEAFTGQLRGMFSFLRDFFPTSKLLWINVHPLNNVDLAVKHIWGGGYFQPTLDVTKDSPLLPPLFSQRRLAQHAQALRQVAIEEEVDSLDVSRCHRLRSSVYLNRLLGTVLEAQGLL